MKFRIPSADHGSPERTRGLDDTARLRVLYSFPHQMGTGRIAETAWEQVFGVSSAGARVSVLTSSLHKQFPPNLDLTIQRTLSRGRWRLPYKLVGSMRAFTWHDAIVARSLRRLAGQVDIVHTWPLGALRTLKVARELGIPTVLERPNAHTRFAMEVVQKECDRLGVLLPPRHEHAYKADVLGIEEQEYELADALLCPSDFVVKTFLNKGFDPNKLVRHTYGFDERLFYPDPAPKALDGPLTMLFVGVCAVRKGVHFALEAWLRSPASKTGKFVIAGGWLPAYADKLAGMLSHPSVCVLGHRNDLAELMRRADILVLPTLEEGSPLVVAEGTACGCVPLVSEVCTEMCKHMETGLVHRVGDVEALAEHITLLHQDRALLARFRANCLRTAPSATWTAAGTRLLQAYEEVIRARGVRKPLLLGTSQAERQEVRFA